MNTMQKLMILTIPTLLLLALLLGTPGVASGSELKTTLQTLVANNVISRTARYRTETQVVQQGEASSVVAVQVHSPLVGEIKMLRKTSNKPGVRPAIFILSGVANGMQAVHLIPDSHGADVFSLEYPFNKSKKAFEAAGDVAGNYLRAIGQIVTALFWIAQQREIDPNRISVIAVSFGSFIAPASLFAAQQLGFQPAATVFAFGGTKIENFLDFAQIQDPVAVEKLKREIKPISEFLDGRHLLADLKGPFLVVRGLRDEVIPADSSLALADRLPQPKTVIDLDTPHINSDKTDVIEQTLAAVIPFLKEQGALIP